MEATKRRFKIDPVDPVRLQWPGLYHAENNLHPNTKYRELIRALLDIGGHYVAMPEIEEDIKEILSRGEYFDGLSRMWKGRPSRCHDNVANLHYTRGFDIVTGYAMSKDGCWRQHSWALRHLDNIIENRVVIETTEKRLCYFGYVLTNEEAVGFVHNNG